MSGEEEKAPVGADKSKAYHECMQGNYLGLVLGLGAGTVLSIKRKGWRHFAIGATIGTFGDFMSAYYGKCKELRLEYEACKLDVEKFDMSHRSQEAVISEREKKAANAVLAEKVKVGAAAGVLGAAGVAGMVVFGRKVKGPTKLVGMAFGAACVVMAGLTWIELEAQIDARAEQIAEAAEREEAMKLAVREEALRTEKELLAAAKKKDQ